MCGQIFNDNIPSNWNRHIKEIRRDRCQIIVPTRGVYIDMNEPLIHEGMMRLLNELPTEKLMELFEVRTMNAYNYNPNTYHHDDMIVDIQFHRDVYYDNGLVQRLTNEISELQQKKSSLKADIEHLDWMIEERLKELTNK